MNDRLLPYIRTQLPGDLAAGLSVAIVAIPQGMAYALIAGVPAKYGLYAVMLPAIVAALAGSSRLLVTGPSNATSLVTFSVIAGLIGTNALLSDAQMPVVFLICLMCGLAIFAAGLLRLGVMLRYVSRAVLAGFTAGAGFLIICMQLNTAMGIADRNFLPAPDTWFWLPIVTERLGRVFISLGNINPTATMFAVGTIAGIWLIRRIDRRIPAELIVVIISGVIVAFTGVERIGLDMVGEIPRTLPPLSMPSLSLVDVETYATGAIAIALLAVVQSMAVAKGIAAQTGDHLNADRELCGLGLANIAAAFTSGIPVGGSFIRTVVNRHTGAKTRAAAAVAGVASAIVVLAFAGCGRYVPIPVLAGIVISAAATLINPTELYQLSVTTRRDAIVMAVTMIATLSIALENAIYFGVLLSIILVIRRASLLHLVEMIWIGRGRYREHTVDEHTGRTPIVVLSLEGTVFFGVADELEQSLRQIKARGATAIIIRLKRAHGLDVTVTDRLKQLAEQFRADNVTLILCGLRPDVLDFFDRAGLEDAIGEENLFLTDKDIFGSVQRAVARARQLLGDRPAPHLFRTEQAEDEPWGYVI